MVVVSPGPVMAMDAPGGGSGVVFDPRGFVLTNFHVVGSPDEGYRPQEPVLPAAELEVWRQENLPRGSAHYRNKKVGMPDGELYEAVVLGIDPGSDLAVLRLVPKRDGQTWPFCTLGDSDRGFSLSTTSSSTLSVAFQSLISN